MQWCRWVAVLLIASEQKHPISALLNYAGLVLNSAAPRSCRCPCDIPTDHHIRKASVRHATSRSSVSSCPVAAGAASVSAPICVEAAGTLEAVEVKNTCPFQAVSWVTAAGKRRSSYVVQDRGPRDEVRG